MSTDTEHFLEKLVSFPTVSRDSNLEMIQYMASYLGEMGIEPALTFNEERTKANLYAVFGPEGPGGVLLSGHTDVVPTDGQHWTVDPFKLTRKNNCFYGRGTTDMKGFIASVLAMIPGAQARHLKYPVHLAFSYDEEIGCVGVRRMIEMLQAADQPPGFCIIGEPTSLEVAIAHKGKTAAVCRCRGVEAHSAMATHGLNSIYLATEMIHGIREIQSEIQATGERDEMYGVPYTTVHVGTIQGGTALNIIPQCCEFRFEIRNLASDDPVGIMARIRDLANAVTAQYSTRFPQAKIEIEIFNEYPPLNTAADDEVVTFVRKLAQTDRFIKVDFGTEGGLFQTRLGLPTVVCGPGSMEQGHKPDEFIEQSQLAYCDAFLARLLDQMCE